MRTATVPPHLQFQNIYDTYYPKIRRYLARLVGDHEADDLAQEVFVKVSQALKCFRGESQLSTWIYRIASNTALDRLRSPTFKRTVSAEEVLPHAEDGAEVGQDIAWMGGSMPPADQQIIRKEMNACIRSFIDNLPDVYRTAIVLSELEGLKNREIAKILGVTLETVKIRLHRARERLKKELGTHCSFYRNEQNELACDLKSALKEYRETH